MKVTEHRRDVVELSCCRHHPSSCVLDRLKLLEQTATSTVQQAVTVIQAAADEGVYMTTYHPQKGRGYDHVTVLKFLPSAVMQRVARVRQRQLRYLYLNNVTSSQVNYQSTTSYPVQRGGRIETIDYCNVTSPYP